MSARQVAVLVELFALHLRERVRQNPAGVSGSACGGIIRRGKLGLQRALQRRVRG